MPIEKGVQMSDVKYPKVKVQLVGQDGNAFAIMGAVQSALKKAGVDKDTISDYLAEAMAGDYNNLLRVTMKWVVVK